MPGFKSRVLPYIDLCQWLEEFPMEQLPEIRAADIATVLKIDPKQLVRTTERQADHFEDHLTWEFMQLSEAVVARHWPSPTLVRESRRRKRDTY